MCRAGYRVQVIGHLVSHDGVVGIVGRQRHLARVDQFLLLARSHKGGPFVRGLEIDLRVERLARSPLVPMRPVERLLGLKLKSVLPGAPHAGRDAGTLAVK